MKRLVLSAAATVAAASLATPASAAITFAGTTQGCFAVFPLTSCAVGPTSIDNGLQFTGGTFTQTTNASGFAAIGGAGNNLGTIVLFPGPHDYSNDLFELLVTFSLPPGTVPGSTFNATLLGSLETITNGGLQISFSNPDQTFTYAGGTFTLHVNDVAFSGSLQNENALSLTQDISGFIRAVPEPGTWAMMLLGFAGIGMAVNRRRPVRLAQIA